MNNLFNSARRAAAVTPNDSTDIPQGIPSIGVYIGGAGTMSADIGGVTVAFSGLLAGTVLPIAPSRIRATGTTATGIVALYKA